MSVTHFREATAEDAEAIVAVFRSGFSLQELDVMILGCDGVSRYVARQIEATSIGGDSKFFLLTAEAGNPIGCVELREYNDELYLNYIGVEPGSRASRLGTKLMLYALQHVRHMHSTLLLDVREDNLVARGWYERMGFQPVTMSEFREFYIPDVASDGSARISGFPQAMASQDAYGFSQFTITTQSRHYTIGMLGDQWFRLTDPTALRNMSVLAALRRVSASRRVLSVLPEGETIDDSAQQSRLIQRTTRMSADLNRLIDYLGR
jgi:ribosomal protein S18 acetylase RimI-like enzyme